MRITPSILNADFANIGQEIARIPSADAVHVDVMDGHPQAHFIPAKRYQCASVRVSRTVKPLGAASEATLPKPTVPKNYGADIELLIRLLERGKLRRRNRTTYRCWVSSHESISGGQAA